MTITSRLEAQHTLLLALRDDYTDLRAEMRRRFTKVEERLTGVEERLTGVEGRLTGVEGRLTGVEERLTGVEDVMGKVLWGMTEIKNLLAPPDDPL